MLNDVLFNISETLSDKYIVRIKHECDDSNFLLKDQGANNQKEYQLATRNNRI
jgi:hypothetical protein